MPKPRPLVPDTEEWLPLELFGPFGGLNLRDNPRSLVNQSPDLLNVDITEDGIIETDLGFTPFGTYSGTDAVTNIREVYKSDGTKYVIRSLGTKLQANDGAGGAWSDIATGLTSGTVWDFVVANDIVYMVNATDTPMKWTFTGSASTVAGITQGDTIDFFNDRLWTASGSTIAYSALGSYETGWSSVTCYQKDGKGKITALRHMNGRQIVIKERQKYSWEALTFSVLAFQPIGQQGTKSLRSVVVAPDGFLYFTNKEGIWRSRGFSQDEYLSRDVETEFIAMDGSKEVNMAAAWFGNEYWLGYTPSGQTVNTKVFRYHPAFRRFLWKDWAAACFCVFEGTDGTKRLIFGSSASDSAAYQRYTARANASYNHSGAPITAYYTLPFTAPAGRNKRNKFKYLFYQFDASGTWYVKLQWRVTDRGTFREQLVYLSLNLENWANDGELWASDGSVWQGQDVIEGYLENFSISKARGLQFRIYKSAINQPFRFLGLKPHFQIIEGFK